MMVFVVMAAVMAVARQQKVFEDIIGNAGPLPDALYFVEAPVDAEVNAALTVFLCCLAETIEGTSDDWADHPVLVDGGAVKFVGADGEMDIVAAVEIRHQA